MVPLNGIDSLFLHPETPSMPMHVGPLQVYEPPPAARRHFAARLRRHVAARLHLHPAFTRRLAPAPPELAAPA